MMNVVNKAYKKSTPLLLQLLLLHDIILLISLSSLLLPQVVTTTHAANKKPTPLPKSKQPIFPTSHLLHQHYPAWNHSPQIDKQGFLAQPFQLHPGSWESHARIGGKYGYNSPMTRHLKNVQVIVRQVPGDGNCLFHSLCTALSWVEEGVHLCYDQGFRGNRRRRRGNGGNGGDCDDRKAADGNDNGLDLQDRSRILRQIAVDVLDPSSSKSENHNPNDNHDDDASNHFPLHQVFWKKGTRRRRGGKDRLLFLQGSEFLRRGELLEVACSQYGITGEEYCNSMRKDGVWGGGPEIVALCNYLKRPIHVYELMTWYPKQDNKRNKKNKREQETATMTTTAATATTEQAEFRLRRMACFGSPKFDYREPICILSADCRFPDLKPGHQAAAGNHFMAILPLPLLESSGGSIKGYHTGGMSVRSGGVVSYGKGGGFRTRRKRGKSTFEKREVVEKYIKPLHEYSDIDTENILGITMKPFKRIWSNGLSMLS